MWVAAALLGLMALCSNGQDSGDDEMVMRVSGTGQPPRAQLFKPAELARLTSAISSGASSLSEGDSATPHLRHEFGKLFDAQTPYPALTLYDVYKPNMTDALAYTVTELSPNSVLGFLLAQDDVVVEPLGEVDDFVKYKHYLAAAKRKEGTSAIGLELKWSAWVVGWRGVEMEIYGLSWTEQVWNAKSQLQIIVKSLSPLATSNLQLEGSTEKERADHAASLFLIEVGDYMTKLGNAVLVYDQGYWRPDAELWKSVQKANWDDVILSDTMKAELQHEYRSFFGSEAIYKDLGVPWKRGVIFLGPPGNGKTFSLKAMMKEVKMPLLYVKTFAAFMGPEFSIRQIFQKARQMAPCLLIFEDVDSLITDNNRSFFLNEVDGLEDNDGLLMVATTNHFDKLDTAISNRPSRFDRKYTFPDPNAEERTAYAKYWQQKLDDNKRVDFPDSLTEDFSAKTKGFSFAYMKEAFVSALLVLASDESHKKTFPTELIGQVHALRKELDAGDDKDNLVDPKGGRGKISPGQVGAGRIQQAMKLPGGRLEMKRDGQQQCIMMTMESEK